MVAKRIVLVLALAAFGGCTTDKQQAPGLTGPSTFGVELSTTASPDVLVRDGVSTSTIEVTAQTSAGAAIPNLTLFFAGQNGLGTLSAQSATTNAQGKASVVFTAPDFGDSITTTLTITPTGTNHQNTLARTVSIRLVKPIV